MTTRVKRCDRCRLCGKKKLETVFSLPPTPPGDIYVHADQLGAVQETYPLDLALCRGCGHVQLLHVVHPDVLYGGYTYTSSVSLGLSEHFGRLVDDVLARAGTSPGSLVVDIGSNDGTLLRHFKARGMRVLGVDPAGDVARRAQDSGIETRVAYFRAELAKALRQEYGPASVVTANNVIANIDDLRDMVEGVRVMLAPDGLFVFETGYVLDLVVRGILDNIYHEHISHFAVKPLVSFFRANGMELVDVRWVDSKGGSLRAFVQSAGGSRKVAPSVAEFVKKEEDAGLGQPGVFRSLSERLRGAKAQLDVLLEGFRRTGKAVAGFGASVGVTTMLYFFDLGRTLPFLVDDNPVKQGLFSPGFHIPVLAADALAKRRPDHLLLLAWRYEGAIVKKHAAYAEAGGRFLRVLPEPCVVGRS